MLRNASTDCTHKKMAIKNSVGLLVFWFVQIVFEEEPHMKYYIKVLYHINYNCRQSEEQSMYTYRHEEGESHTKHAMSIFITIACVRKMQNAHDQTKKKCEFQSRIQLRFNT